ncbi:hypothetical protein AOLI_G00016100 [Acnodon oligacanthus]
MSSQCYTDQAVKYWKGKIPRKKSHNFRDPGHEGHIGQAEFELESQKYKCPVDMESSSAPRILWHSSSSAPRQEIRCSANFFREPPDPQSRQAGNMSSQKQGLWAFRHSNEGMV